MSMKQKLEFAVKIFVGAIVGWPDSGLVGFPIGGSEPDGMQKAGRGWGRCVGQSTGRWPERPLTSTVRSCHVQGL